MKRPARPARALFVVMPFTIFFLPFTLLDEFCINTIKYTKYYPREECRRMPCFFFILPPPGLTTYQFNSNILNNFFTCSLSFCCKALPMVAYLYTSLLNFQLSSYTRSSRPMAMVCQKTEVCLWRTAMKVLPYSVGFFMALPYLKERFYLPFYFQHMQWRPCTVLN